MAFSLRNLRFRCAISWIQSFCDDVTFPFPREVLSYPYTDLYTFTIRSELIWWLTRGDPYFCIIAHLASVPTNQIASFEEAVQTVTNCGVELDPVLLARRDPFLVEQHLALVEGIMGLCCATYLSTDSVATQLHKLSDVAQSVGSLEEGLVSWLRLVCDLLRKRVHLDSDLVPEVTSLTSCLSNGCLLLLLMHFYIPQCIQLSNGKFPPKPDDPLGLEEAFHNSTLVSNACMLIPQLKFCLSSQAIVRSSDPLMLPYVTVSLVSMFLCFELSENYAIYRTPALYGALIGQATFPSRLRSSAKFHSMDSVARRGSSSTECLIDKSNKNQLITPSTENLIASLHSNTSSVYPRDELSRPSSRFRTPALTIKSSSNPELSRAGYGTTGIVRITQDLTQSSIANIITNEGVISPNRSELDIHPKQTPAPVCPKEAWSPLKKELVSPSFPNCVEENNSSSDGSIPSGESVASLEPKLEIKSSEEDEIIRLNIFPVARETLPTNLTSQLLRTGQSNDSVTFPVRDPIREKLGQLAFSFVLANQDRTFEEYICSQLKINTIEEINDVINSQSIASKQTQNGEINTIPFNETGNQVEEPQIHSPATQQPIERQVGSQDNYSPKQTKPLAFYEIGNDAPNSPCAATERAKSMLRMLETRNTARQAAKQTAHSAKTHVQAKQAIPTVELITPSVSSNSLQSLHSNDMSTQLGSNQADSTKHKPARTKNPSENIPQPSKHKSNKQMIKNAICDVCLAGGPNSVKKFEIVSNLAEHQADHFLILFRDIIGCKFRGVYAYSQEADSSRRIGGSGPREVTSDMLVKLYKYNSGAKEFQEIPARRISSSIDAFTIHDALWVGRKKRQAVHF